MRSWISRAILAMAGWRIGPPPPTIPKFVMIAAPHTSSWDVPLLILYAWVYKMDVRWMMKAEMFHGWRGPLFKALGAMPIDRSQRHNTVQQCIDAFQASERMILAVPPEGTRAAAKGWKTGFYYIAHGAQVPIALAYLDFGRKEAGFGPTLTPTGDIEADFDVLRDFYKDKAGKYPERFGEIRVLARDASRDPEAE